MMQSESVASICPKRRKRRKNEKILMAENAEECGYKNVEEDLRKEALAKDDEFL